MIGSIREAFVLQPMAGSARAAGMVQMRPAVSYVEREGQRRLSEMAMPICAPQSRHIEQRGGMEALSHRAQPWRRGSGTGSKCARAVATAADRRPNREAQSSRRRFVRARRSRSPETRAPLGLGGCRVRTELRGFRLTCRSGTPSATASLRSGMPRAGARPCPKVSPAWNRLSLFDIRGRSATAESTGSRTNTGLILDQKFGALGRLARFAPL